MANLEAIIGQKTEHDTQWREQQQAERENTVAMQDAGITEITSNPEAYARYLDMQGDNRTYSDGNIAVVMLALPQATMFGTRDRWRSLNRSIVSGEENKGVKIFAKGPMGRGYILADAYDVSQTQGRDLKHPILKDDSKEMTTALKTVLNYSVCPVTVDKELTVPAYYDAGRMELAVNPDFPDHEAFPAIVAEVAHSRMHAKGVYAAYSRAECDLDAQSVSYILCRRYGIDRPMPDTSALPELYEGWDAQERRQALDSIQDMSKKMGRSIDKNLDADKQRSRAPIRRPAR